MNNQEQEVKSITGWRSLKSGVIHTHPSYFQPEDPIYEFIHIPTDFLEHLLNCMANMEIRKDVNADGISEGMSVIRKVQEEGQKACDEAYAKARELLHRGVLPISSTPPIQEQEVKRSPNSLWLVVYECRYDVIRISATGDAFYAPGQDVEWRLSAVSEWVKEITPPVVTDKEAESDYPTKEAYEAACKALWKHRSENENLEAKLRIKEECRRKEQSELMKKIEALEAEVERLKRENDELVKRNLEWLKNDKDCTALEQQLAKAKLSVFKALNRLDDMGILGITDSKLRSSACQELRSVEQLSPTPNREEEVTAAAARNRRECSKLSPEERQKYLEMGMKIYGEEDEKVSMTRLMRKYGLLEKVEADKPTDPSAEMLLKFIDEQKLQLTRVKDYCNGERKEWERMNIKIVMAHGAMGASENDSILESSIREIALMCPHKDGDWVDKYGSDFENKVFMMHSFCWCEKDDCPWCMGCNCPESAYHYFVDGVEVVYGEYDAFFQRQVNKYNGNHKEWMKEADVANSRRETKKDEICPFCKDGLCMDKGAEKGKRAPNFWHKPSGLKIWWYKYIGREMELSRDVTFEEIRTIREDCITSLTPSYEP